MNERIRSLAEQANGPNPFFGTLKNQMTLLGDDAVEKFAELIVRECMDLAWAEQKRYANITHRNMSECAVAVSNFRLLMKDHFGVEE